MPLIEELPLGTAARAQPGWAYVPDTNTPIAAIQPGQRKRARGTDTPAFISAKQQKAIEARLKDLDRENYKDVQIVIPKRECKREKKITSNVRRILGYNRTFQHYLSDEEAAIAVGQVPYYLQGFGSLAGDGRGGRDVRKGSGANTPSRLATSRVKAEAEDVNMVTDQNAVDQDMNAAQIPPYPPEWDKDPLLRTRDLPPRPSDRVMEQLLDEPPLSWNEARAKPLDPDKQPPPRHFCIICGYWGKVKCKKCAERTCGTLECWKAHEAAGCGDRPY